MEKSGRECHVPQFTSEPPVAAKIWEDNILRLFIIQEDLFPVPRSIPAPGSDKARRVARHDENCRILAPHVARLKPQHAIDARLGNPQHSSTSDTIMKPSMARVGHAPSVASTRTIEAHPMIDEFRRAAAAQTHIPLAYKPSARVFYWENVHTLSLLVR
jgi:hypothetical protein